MHNCEHCGEEVFRTHVCYSNEYGGWYCFECWSELGIGEDE